jgi:LytS/YehU family sensor histidine kinase
LIAYKTLHGTVTGVTHCYYIRLYICGGVKKSRKLFDLISKLTKKTLYLPQMCLQILIENTIQHNETSEAKTLRVNIYSSHSSLVIENNIQKRRDKIESSGTGLKNIQSRYSFFTDKKVEVLNDEKLFKVILPLLSKI